MNGSEFLSPSRTLVTSFNPKTTTASQWNAAQNGGAAAYDFFEEGDWVLCVTSRSNDATPWIGCALSNGEIQVYDQSSLHALQSYSYDALVTDLVHDVSNPNALIASAADGTVSIFDIRQALQSVSQMKFDRPEEEALSVSMGFNGSIAAIGSSKARIHFYDVRNTQSAVGVYNQAHTDEITRVRFQTSPPNGMMAKSTSTLLSAAEDGLVCVYDTSKPTEESAIQNVLPVQSPIREVGFFGPQSDAIYCLTGSESLLLYHKDDSVCRKDFGCQLRGALSQQLSPTAQSGRCNSIDYLVDCHWDVARQQLLLLAGNAHGDSSVFHVGDHGISLHTRLQGGHKGVVRAWNHLSTNIFVTVGEDARMCEWNRMSSLTGGSLGIPQSRLAVLVSETAGVKRRHPGPVTGAGGGKMRRPKSRMSSSPY